MSKQIDLGEVTAYAIAKKHGYVGTEAQFAEEMTGAAQSAREAAQDASDAEAYAKGTRDGVDVESSDSAYHNNAKYWAQQAPNITSLAPAYSASATYAVGDLVTYNNKLYTCVSAITTAEAWTAAHWSETSTGTELTNLKGDLSEISTFPLEAKLALIEMFRHVAYSGDDGELYLNALKTALELFDTIVVQNIVYGYGLGNTIYTNYMYEKASRACYPYFDINIKPKTCYMVTWNRASHPDSMIAFCAYDQAYRNAGQSSQELTIQHMVETSWMRANSVVQMPDRTQSGQFVGIRISVKADEDDSEEMGNTGIVPIVLKEVDYDPSKTHRFICLGELEPYTGVYNASPYYALRNERICYWKSDFPVTAGRYYISWHKNECPDSQCGIDVLNEQAVNDMANGLLMNQNDDMYLPGYQSESFTMTVPASINGKKPKAMRITFRRDTSDTAFDETHLVRWVRIQYLGE